MAAAGLGTAPATAAPNSEIGYPTFTGSAQPVPATGVPFTPANQLRSVFDADVAAGAGSSPDQDFWMDRMLVRTGTAGSFGDENQWLFSRGRAAFMKVHDPAVLGFGGQLAYWEAIDGRAGYAVTALVDGAVVALTEDTAQRKQTPSYWRSVHRASALGLEVVQTKFMTDENVLVTELEVRSTAARTVTLRAASPYATVPDGDELTGHVRALNDLTTIHPRLSGDGFTVADGAIQAAVEVPAGGAVTTKVQLGLLADELPGSRTEYDAVRAATSAEAYTSHVTAYNRWWAENVPYLDTPEDNIDKTLFYRWWLMRFNFLDADIPGNTYQFPTSMEGVLGYNNSIVLTTGMFIDDLKYFRDPVYSYGPWVSAGETSKSYKYVDNPGDPANWSNSYTQYISEAAWRSYQLHGGPVPIAENLGRYAEDDVRGLIDAYDSDDSGLIDYNWGAMTGNDADAVSFHERPNQYMDRAENAYLYSNALAAAEAYRLAGDTENADEMDAFAQDIKTKVLDLLWDGDENLLKHRWTSDGAFAKWKEINNYYPYAVGLMPKPGDADYDDDYVDALRLFADDSEYPIFPFYTANQADQAEYGGPGSNNFSVINSTVTFRMLSRVLRDYPTEAIDAEWYKKLLYWNAWSHYQNGGDNRLPDQNEFWSNGSADPQSIGYRSWIHHTVLGATNFTVIEDAMGLRPRSDAKVELDPIDVDWDHFAVDNVRYRDRDLTVTWDAPGGEDRYGSAVPDGYSVFLDGDLAFTVSDLAHVVYDPATGEVEVLEGDATVTSAVVSTVQVPQDVRFADDARVVDLFAKAGADIRSGSAGSTDLAAGATATATFSASGREPAGAVDGTTVNEPFWGTAGSPDAKDSLTVELGGEKTFDEARVYFYDTSSSATVRGYQEPSVYTLEVRSGGQWSTIPQQARTPAEPRANLNRAQFPEVTGDALRVTVTHAGGARTGIKEVQVAATGVQAPAATNRPPLVTAWEDLAGPVAGQATLVGTAKDDGLPSGDLTSTWSVVEAPQGATVLFDDAGSASTTARFSAAGTYVLRLTATDGAVSSSAEVTVQGQASTQGANVAPDATPTAEYTAGWNRVTAVNDGVVLHSGGDQAAIWGTWSGNHPATRWLQYDWAEPVRVSDLEVSFWSDQSDPASTGGVNVPAGWVAQYWDGAGWVDVANADGYPVQRDAPNAVSFDPVETTRMRLVLNAVGSGSTYAAVAVSEWKVFAERPDAVEPVDVRTTVGVLPELPATVDATYADGSRAALPVQWEQVTQEQVAGEGSFTVPGIVAGLPLPATATVWVRATPPGQVNQVDAVDVRTVRGTAPDLPASVGVLYNDGSREDLPVTWAQVDPADYAQEGTFTVDGTVQTDLPGTTTATATVTVTAAGGGDTRPPRTTVTTAPSAPASGWFTGPVSVTVAATDETDPAPVVEVRVDGGTWSAYTEPVAVTTDGAHTVEARATDAAGNVSTVTTTSVKIDTAAPDLTVVTDEVARTVKAAAVDGGSGVASVQHRYAGEDDWRPLTGTLVVGLDEVRVELRAIDVAGNVSAVQEVTVAASDGDHRRNTALWATPTASFTAPWNRVTGLNDDVQPTSSGDVTPSDNENVWGAWPQVTDQWVQYDWAEPVTVARTGVWFVSNIDAAGLGIEVPQSWHAEYWDATAGAWAPVEASTPYGTEVDTYNVVEFAPVTTTKVRLVLEASGTVSGQGSLGIKEWQLHEPLREEEPDTTAPQVAVQVTPAAPASGWYRQDVTVTATALDDRDGELVVQVRRGTGAWAAYTGPVVLDTDGVHRLSFRATDAAGNVSDVERVRVARDTHGPAVGTTWSRDGKKLTLTATDRYAGVRALEYRVGNGAWRTYTRPLSVGKGVVVQVRARDAAGNVTVVRTSWRGR